MTVTPPNPRPITPGSEIDPANTALLKIAGTLIAIAGLVLLGFGVLLTVAFGGSDPLWHRLFANRAMWIFLLIAAAGAGLILRARQRERLYRQHLK